jgi:glycosyltransferase involved in cell wall biosynthesis
MSLYIDVSHIMLWNGRLSGIERVEYNIIKHYIQSNEDAKYIFWSETTSNFHLKERSFIEKFIKNIENSQQQDSVGNQQKKNFLKRIRNKLSTSKNSEPVIEALESDMILILDGLWDKNGYIEAVKQLADNASVHHIVYDMIPALKPGFVLDFMASVFEVYMKTILPLCDYVYAISENSATDTRAVLKSWGVRIPHVEAFRLGDDILVNEKIEEKEKQEYILAAGTIEVRKNYPLIAYMYGIAKEKNIELPKTIIVGKRGWLSGDFQYMVEHDNYLKEKIHIYDNITDNKLAQLYSDSLFVLCPSYYEGWGLPVREALAYGKVTLSSNTSSLPEAGGNIADYFSPHSAQELFDLVQKYLNTDTRIKREAEIKRDYTRMNWAEATEYLDKKIFSNSRK